MTMLVRITRFTDYFKMKFLKFLMCKFHERKQDKKFIGIDIGSTCAKTVCYERESTKKLFLSVGAADRMSSVDTQKRFVRSL